MKRHNFGLDYRPIVHMDITPNGIEHIYRVAQLDGPVTDTPHVEVRGFDLSKTYGYTAAMDEETRVLYDTVHALHAGITAVSMGRYTLVVDGPEKSVGGYSRGNWPTGLDADVIRCLTSHLGWQNEPFVVRRQISEEELWIKLLNMKAISESGEDVELGEWPYRV